MCRNGLFNSFQSICALELQAKRETGKVRMEKYGALLMHLSFLPLSPPVFMDAQPSLYLSPYLTEFGYFLNTFLVSSKELQNRNTVTTCFNRKPAYMLQQAAQLIRDDPRIVWGLGSLCLETRVSEEPLGLLSPLTVFYYSYSPLLLPTIRILGFCVLVGFSVLLFTDLRPHYVCIFWNTISCQCPFYIL